MRAAREASGDGDLELDLSGSPNFNGANPRPSADQESRKTPRSVLIENQEPLEAADALGSGADTERRRRKNLIKVGGQYRNEGIWLAFNKYLYTIVLLFMATFHLNLLGFIYFVLFLLHTFAYYSFRSKSRI